MKFLVRAARRDDQRLGMARVPKVYRAPVVCTFSINALHRVYLSLVLR